MSSGGPPGASAGGFPVLGLTSVLKQAQAGAWMPKDWDAVARAIDSRMRELDLTQTDLAVRADVAPETVRELRNNLKPRRRNPRTLAAVSEALGWPPGHLGAVLAGDNAAHKLSSDGPDSVQAEIANLKQAVEGLAERLDSVERRLGAKST